MPSTTALEPPSRILLGPGPSIVHPRVLRAMSTPLIGHLDPAYLRLMDETSRLLRYAFQTENQLPIPISATGSAGMDACFVNLLEPGDETGLHARAAGRGDRNGELILGLECVAQQ